MRIKVPRGSSLPRGQAAATGVIAGLLSLAVVEVLCSGMALVPSALLTLIVAVVILLVVATMMATFSESLQRLTDRLFGDEEADRGEGEPPPA